MTELTTNTQAPLTPATLEALVIGGDLRKLSPQQKIEYYTARCHRAGLDPATQPFQLLELQGKLTLYATKACTDQLASLHGIRLSILEQKTEEGIRMVTVRAEARDGRTTEEIGALPIVGLKGDALANALMKCCTKAKRRAVLSLCGLGMLDETELDTVRDARPQGFASNTVTTLKPPTQAPIMRPVDIAQADETLPPEPASIEGVDVPVMPRYLDPDNTLVMDLPVPNKVLDGWDNWKKYGCIDDTKKATSRSALRDYTWAQAAEGSPDGKRQASLEWTVNKAKEELANDGRKPTLFAARCAVALFKLKQAAAGGGPEGDALEDYTPW